MDQCSIKSKSRVAEFQQLFGSWATLLSRLYDDPKVAQLMKTRIRQYLNSHPFFALTVMLFGAMSAIPVGMFLSFALVTIIMSAVGLVFFEAFLLFVGGTTLLCVLSGIALFSVMVSFIFNALYFTISNILSRYNPNLTKQHDFQEKESEGETSKTKEM
ncbi:lipid droplet assembly factor 1-like [Pseudochaenichthys georgianus]|uniref:lipid droplet assembly factor 1-like n=1 Tax=Pseudochaenichthys georgianus TaxID=52239 RepID=UPI00146E1CC5|nr:lipid droplet assembly factor 1-like [Pseudochaenichthys georgianus]